MNLKNGQTMETKQTALDLLFDEIKRGKVFMMLPDPMFTWLEIVYNKAKQMEKEQIIEAAHHGVDFENSPYENAEQYYDKTYGN